MVKVFAYISLLIFLYYISYGLYNGLINPVPALGDSWDYHIPISESIINGTFINLPNPMLPQWYYPGSAEAINSLFLLLDIPLTISNLFALIVLVFVCFKLARTFQLTFYSSLLFAMTIGSLTVLTRWMNSVSIDIWVAIFFVCTIILLEKFKANMWHFLLLGITLGMLLGSKYMAIAYVLLLLIVYARKILDAMNVRRLLIFFIPFSILGLFWYVRNYFLVGNPMYPLCVFNLPCDNLFQSNVLEITINHPKDMLNAVFGEYKLWMLSPLIILLSFARGRVRSPKGFILLSFIGLINLCLYLFYPTSEEPWIMVSSLRYSYPAFIPLILALFIWIDRSNYELKFGYFILANMLPTLSMAFYPKLLLIYFPLFIMSYFLLEKQRLHES